MLLACATSAYAESGLLVYQNSSVKSQAIPISQAWNESDFLSPSNASFVSGKLQWVVLKNNPARDELVLATLDNFSDVMVQFSNFSGAWSGAHNLTSSDGITTFRSFDIGVEQNSGDVMAAYNDGSLGTVAYQVWNGTSWYESGNLTTNFTQQVDWIKIAESSSNNNLMLLAATNKTLIAASWNGTNWSALQTLGTNLEIASDEDFDAAYENSGDALVVWTEGSTANVRYNTYSSGAWGVEAGAPASAGQLANFDWLRLRNYPNTDRIMLCAEDASSDLNCVEWTGNGWGSDDEIDALVEFAAGVSFRNFDVVPDTSSGSFFVLYGDSNVDYYSSARCFGSANCQAGSWETVQTFLSGVDIGTDTSWVSLSYDPENPGKITAVMLDQTANPFLYIARISCSNSANSCAADQQSTLFSRSTSRNYESAMFAYEGKRPSASSENASSLVASSTLMTITLAGVNDLNNNTLNLYCSDSSAVPDSSSTICTGGNTTVDAPYPGTSCSYTSQSTDGSYTVYCRLYDGGLFSPAMNATYTVSSSAPSTSVISVAGDTTASYYDTANDGATLINVSGESGMTCRWATSDLSYLGMSNSCTTSGTQSACNITGISSEGFYTRYVACSNILGIGQNSSQNLDIGFFLDYNAPTTSDNSTIGIHVPPYVVKIQEADAVDSDPTSFYCTSQSQGCTPATSIDNGGLVTFTSALRGDNYLRYYSVDDAGNTQTIVNKTISINQLPALVSAADDADRIEGGTIVNISTDSSDPDSGQNITLFVCGSASANFSGCGLGEYCNTTGTANLSCSFVSESDSTTHTWYAYIFDEIGEEATANPGSGSYTTDSAPPSLTVANPSNGSTLTQNSVTLTIVANEALGWAVFSINSQANVTLVNVSGFEWSYTNSSIADGSYNLTFYANDTYGNQARASGYFFTVDSTAGDTTPPVLTVRSPINGTYYTSSSVLLNVTSDESLSWAGYSINSGASSDLGNVSPTSWNATPSLSEGNFTITFHANDSSSNHNQGNKTVRIFVDLTNPSVNSFSCSPNPANNSQNVSCGLNISHGIGLNYAIISQNSSGNWSNSSQIQLNGTITATNYTILSANTSVGTFIVQAFVFSLSGRQNSTTSYVVNISDDKAPGIYNVTYSPNTTAGFDPGVPVLVNATIVEDYNMSSVVLRFQNTTSGVWNSINMTNLSAAIARSASTVIYNASFTPSNGTWIFEVVATDSAGNQNLSSNYTIEVQNDLSYVNGTSLVAIKSFTFAQRSDNSTLGWFQLNNTGDQALNFTVNLSSSINSRFSINYTGSQGSVYQISAGTSINLSITANTTGLAAGLYGYTINVSSNAGATFLDNNINIQTASGPYLVVSIDTFTSSVSKGDAGVVYSAIVTNLGTSDATGVYLNWSLPSAFSLVSGSLTRNLGTLPISTTGTNSITIDVASDTGASSGDITAVASSSNAVTASSSKTVTISDPSGSGSSSPSSSSSGGGGVTFGGGGSEGNNYKLPNLSSSGTLESVAFSEAVEVVRGQNGNSFGVTLAPLYPGTSLENLSISLTGYSSQYISVSPASINRIDYGQTKTITIALSAPSYLPYEEHDLTLTIKGFSLNESGELRPYLDTRNIHLIIQEINRTLAEDSLREARLAIDLMKGKDFNTDEAENLLLQAEQKLDKKRNKEALDLAYEIAGINETAFKADSLIRTVIEVNNNPHGYSLLVGNVVRQVGDESEIESLRSLLADETAFTSPQVKELVTFAIAAFERGDYSTALERADNAKTLLLLERKGNFGVFFYLYWPYLLAGILLLSFAGMFGLRIYQKASISGRIRDADREEANLQGLLASSQNEYFSGKISPGEYKAISAQHQKRIAQVRKIRTSFRNRRIKLLNPAAITQELDSETAQIEDEIRSLQEKYYKERKIPEHEYSLHFKAMQERLAEIETERTALNLLRQKAFNAEKSGGGSNE